MLNMLNNVKYVEYVNYVKCTKSFISLPNTNIATSTIQWTRNFEDYLSKRFEVFFRKKYKYVAIPDICHFFTPTHFET